MGASRRSTLARACAIALTAALAGCQAAIESGLTEEQANAVVVALHERDIGAEKVPGAAGGTSGTFDVRVASEDVGTALEVLRAAELPRREEPGLVEVFGEGGLVPTATEERARYVAGLAGDLARSLESIDGVLDARVHLALPDTRGRPLDETPPRPRASVLLKQRPGAPPYPAESVQALVAGAVHGMEPGDVAVVAVEGPPPPETAGALVQVGPIAVTRGTAPALKGLLGAAFALTTLLAALLLYVTLRGRRRATLPVAAEPPA